MMESTRHADYGRPVYVYRLVVEYPEGSQRWDWRPEGWEPPEWDGNPNVDYSFRWPQVRQCLSASTAKRRAKLLESYGAKVLIERSAPVVWGEQIDGEDYGPGPGDVDDSPEYHAARSGELNDGSGGGENGA